MILLTLAINKYLYNLYSSTKLAHYNFQNILDLKKMVGHKIVNLNKVFL